MPAPFHPSSSLSRGFTGSRWRLALCAARRHVSGPQRRWGYLMTPNVKAKLARATAIQQIALRFMRKHGRWDRFSNGGEMLKYEAPVFVITGSIQEPMAPELRRVLFR